VDVVDAYRSEPVPLSEAQEAALAEAEIVTFTSSSTVTNLLAAAGGRPLPPVVAAIGPVTAATAREHGLDVAVEAEVHTIDGLVDALVSWAAEHPASGA
jgi:uroporphyrinogen III methyltransferase/synthase